MRPVISMFHPLFRAAPLLGVALVPVDCGGQSGDGDATEGATDVTSSTTAGATSSSTSGSGSTGSTTDDGSTTTDGGTASAGFIMEPDCGVPCPHCDPTEQDCPEGEKCGAFIETNGFQCVDANMCMPIIGTKGLGEFCTREGDNDDCDRGLVCLSIDGCTGQDGAGICAAFCDADDSCDGTAIEDGECFAWGDSVLILCGGECDPLASWCGDGYGCYQGWPARFMCIETMLTGSGDDGAPCDRVQGCLPGLLCQPAVTLADCGGDHCCTPVCDLMGDGSECTTPMESCRPYFDGNAPPGLEQVGGCGVP